MIETNPLTLSKAGQLNNSAGASPDEARATAWDELQDARGLFRKRKKEAPLLKS